MPTQDDLIYAMSVAKFFSTNALNKGYHQLELDEESRYITTFTTHWGLFRYKRLSFGINSAAEIFQKAIYDMVKDIKGVTNISDDIIEDAGKRILETRTLCFYVITGTPSKRQEDADRLLRFTESIHSRLNRNQISEAFNG